MIRIFKKSCRQMCQGDYVDKKTHKSKPYKGRSHGSEPSIANTPGGDAHNDAPDTESIHCHGSEPSIACPPGGTSHGSEPSIAYIPGSADVGNEHEHKAQYNMKSGTDQQKIESNLTRSEQASLKILQKGVESGELIITETDKSGKFCVLRRDQYLQSGAKHTSGDLEVEWEQVQSIQKAVNDHCKG